MSPSAGKVLAIIDAFLTERGRPPLDKEIAFEMGWASHGPVRRALDELKRLGKIYQIDNVRSGLRVARTTGSTQ